MANYGTGTFDLTGVILPVTAAADTNSTTTFNLIGLLDTFNIYSAAGSSVTVNNNVDVANTLNLYTNGGSLTLASSVGALGATTVNINGGSFTIASSLISAQLLSNTVLSFGSSGGTAVFGSTSSGLLNLSLVSVFGPIQNFVAATDKLDDPALNFTNVTGYTISAVSGQAGVQQIVVNANNGGSFTFDVTGAGLTNGTYSTTNGPLYLVSDGTGGTIIEAACFLTGTAISTPHGEVAVESLKIGDLVLTDTGEAVPVRWIGTRRVSPRFADPVRSLPIRIAAGALGDGLPRRDLLISPDHALLVDHVLLNAGAMVNGSDITREAMSEIFTYYHVEVDAHELILAEGVSAEIFIDHVGRMAFDNWAEHEAIFGDTPEKPEMGYARVKSARQLPMALRRRLGIAAAA